MDPAAEPSLSVSETDSVVDLTSDEFFAMIEAGIFPTGRRVYLWGGRVCEKAAKTPVHAVTAYQITETLRPQVSPDWIFFPENPIALGPRYAPLPDVTLVRGPIQRYYSHGVARHPDVGDVGLVVEVVVTGLKKDLGSRAGVFAAALVPNYWVADVLGRRLVAHHGPRVLDGVQSYETVRSISAGGEVELILDGRRVGLWPVESLLPGVTKPPTAD